MEPNENILYLQQCVQKALEYLVQLSNIPEDELFKICLDFWHVFCNNVMMKVKGDQYFNSNNVNAFNNYNMGRGMNFNSILNSSFMHN